MSHLTTDNNDFAQRIVEFKTEPNQQENQTPIIHQTPSIDQTPTDPTSTIDMTTIADLPMADDLTKATSTTSIAAPNNQSDNVQNFVSKLNTIIPSQSTGTYSAKAFLKNEYFYARLIIIAVTM